MLTPYSHSRFVTKTLVSLTGEQFSVVFLVSLIDGKVNAQIISAKSLSKPSVICLPHFCTKQVVISTEVKTSTKKVESPFNSFFFFNSQPTRAPSYK